ncbi:MAG: tRNA 2-thiouridine(34) synthase MnmA [Deltaproteobacteria bacterium]|nr:tRNA 2-thiouridine(34) synthase MnmA [Deltaproteobacteria bacterium]
MMTRAKAPSSETRAQASPGVASATASTFASNSSNLDLNAHGNLDFDVGLASLCLERLAGQRVAVAMSGGVDSAVAALRLKEAGALPVGLSLRLHDPDPDNPAAPRACCPPDDLQDARRVAEALDIPFYVVDARSAFGDQVVRPFVDAYLAGRTPNPCVGCNSFVKLDTLYRRAMGLGCAALATGHFARVTRDAQGKTRLFTGRDANKDQSYFLFGLSPAILNTLVFPIGELTKADVRARAVSAGLPIAHKLESQEVCFVGGAGAGDFVMRQPGAAGDHRGPIRDASGQVLGEHEGVMRFTVGQRRGLGVSSSTPLYVLNIDAKEKTLTVGARAELGRRGLMASGASWISGRPTEPVRVTARIRYRDRGTPATAYALDDERVRVEFDRPAFAVAKGQAVVFYQGPEVLGGAWIEEALP